ncbi:Rieske (2Fe-2S) protein [Nesterenkonia sp.]|uniref:QcrA and Rieske domain-containing protein n=1 Tax=Nesterenkonia sp. TaxID=704201 RepID=UPI002612656C|nr:Rieske (2Fe-2S) protein [Nesterenkonia sp.]
MASTCCRREFLGYGCLGASALALTACGGEEEPSGWTDLIRLDEVPSGSAVKVSAGDRELLVHRSAEDEVQVLSAVCPHQGCAVEVDSQRYVCPCHDSQFELDGELIAGPAQQGLETVTSRVEGGMVRAEL